MKKWMEAVMQRAAILTIVVVLLLAWGGGCRRPDAAPLFAGHQQYDTHGIVCKPCAIRNTGMLKEELRYNLTEQGRLRVSAICLALLSRNAGK
ncbi:hypothetical protein MJA45_05720 [Paenibacillus aurantius]|uniref:Uncharacterized protein n=1 Tax=Paenibacillus aurantius TaxID=2918900 RepID=A0AA96LGC4_9BACL|nr:hypothetical protein [Paenibacillus aurantius]WNQ12528.1 hypothetical protein MJA45_05720 [Paenibacillus aurantius]